MKIVVMGAPGCGKGTQCPAMTERYNVCHLSTGDMLRAAVAAGTDNGKRAKAAMDSGSLVTDDIVFGIVKDAMQAPECQEGYIIDGLPRTLTQAKKMEASGIAVDKVISFEVPDEVIVKRTAGRWIHRQSGRSYHTIFNPPKVAGSMVFSDASTAGNGFTEVLRHDVLHKVAWLRPRRGTSIRPHDAHCVLKRGRWAR